jgi:hypothetical protein
MTVNAARWLAAAMRERILAGEAAILRHRLLGAPPPVPGCYPARAGGLWL